MKSAILSLAIVLAAALAPTVAESRRVPLNREFQVRIGEWVSIENSGLKIDFTDVAEDSRCPENVKCVWTGNGKVVLLVTLRGRRPGKINLNTMLDPKESYFGDFGIKLVKLDPYPKEGSHIKKGDYLATLVVKRK